MGAACDVLLYALDAMQQPASEPSVPKLGASECLQPVPVGEVSPAEQTLGKPEFGSIF